jgi:DNA-binding transcriptional regulator GbsR (MarR family)
MKVVRFANTAFFAGDRTQSFHAMEDGLKLFESLGNQKVRQELVAKTIPELISYLLLVSKAIGVANNNVSAPLYGT